ncbi:MAG: hypothetical protein GTO16_05140 [Candidatus Aminicenantes bacterium]|nr:hypothetical protein [Candidatus Aminicenantes bacterium]
MSDCKKCQDLFCEAFYEELDAEQKNFLEAHISVCEGCESEYDEMTSTLKLMEKRARPEPGQAYWNGYWNKLKRKMEEEKTLAPKSESWWRTFFRAFTVAPKWALQTAAAVVLVVLGIYLGKMIFSPSAPELQQARQLSTVTSQVEQSAEFINRAQNYIERSKLILLALINFDPETEDPYVLNLSHQQQVSRELVSEVSYLKRGIADYDQRHLQDLITDLEVILLQIANLESDRDFEAIELVKKGVDSRGILLQIHVTDFRKFTKIKDKTTPSSTASNTILNM